MTHKPQSYVWDDYVAEAEAPDFVLTGRDGTELLRVTNPTGTRVMRVSEGLRRGDLDVVLMGLTGDAYAAATALLSKAGAKALPRLVEDLMAHFDMYDEVELVAPGGNIVKATKPTEIRALLKAGYQAGER